MQMAGSRHESKFIRHNLPSIGSYWPHLADGSLGESRWRAYSDGLHGR